MIMNSDILFAKNINITYIAWNEEISMFFDSFKIQDLLSFGTKKDFQSFD